MSERIESKINHELTSCMAAGWLKMHFSVDVDKFGEHETPVGILCSVIAHPYDEHWRVRIAWLGEGGVDVNVRHNPTGDVYLAKQYPRWEDAAIEISNAVKIL